MVRATNISEDPFVGGERRKRYKMVRTSSKGENPFVGCEVLYVSDENEFRVSDKTRVSREQLEE